MREISLSRGLIAQIDDTDSELVNRYAWFAEDYRGKFRARATGTKIYMHRLIMGDPPDGHEIDHINGDALDNRRSNLRFCTRSQNAQNRGKRKGTTQSLYKGITRNKKGWQARITVDGKRISLGLFKNELEAALAYDTKAKELFGEYAKCNF
jgi:hypothetical protein